MGKDTKRVIGRVEKLDIPGLQLSDLEAKADTGAYTSSLHCSVIRTYRENKKLWVEFVPLDESYTQYTGEPVQRKAHRVKRVKSSNGQVDERAIIQEQVHFAGDVYTMEFTLADRTDMRYPVLLGRKFLRKFMVDPERKFLES
ncbi:MAG: ATP-dependent zinc protease [Balneolaceae bacterium]